MGLTFPRRDRPAKFNYVTFPISAVLLPDVSDVQASALLLHSGCLIEQAASAASFSNLFPSSYSTPTPTGGNVNLCLAWKPERTCGRHRRSSKPTTLPQASAAAILLFNKAGSFWHWGC